MGGLGPAGPAGRWLALGFCWMGCSGIAAAASAGVGSEVGAAFTSILLGSGAVDGSLGGGEAGTRVASCSAGFPKLAAGGTPVLAPGAAVGGTPTGKGAASEAIGAGATGVTGAIGTVGAAATGATGGFGGAETSITGFAGVCGCIIRWLYCITTPGVCSADYHYLRALSCPHLQGHPTPIERARRPKLLTILWRF